MPDEKEGGKTQVVESLDITKTVGAEIHRLRSNFKMSKRTLALLIGTTSGRMSKIERGRVLPFDYEFIRLCHLFGKYPHDFIVPPNQKEKASDFSFVDVEDTTNFCTLVDLIRISRKMKDPKAMALFAQMISIFDA